MYAIGTVASKAVGFFLVPIYTYNMSSDEYGIATTVTSFVSTFGIVVMLSLRAAMIRFYNQYDQKEKKRFVGTIVSFVMLNAVVICTLLCLFHNLYTPFIFKDISFFPCIFLGILSLGTETVYLLYQSLLQARQEGKKYSDEQYKAYRQKELKDMLQWQMTSIGAVSETILTFMFTQMRMIP